MTTYETLLTQDIIDHNTQAGYWDGDRKSVV